MITFPQQGDGSSLAPTPPTPPRSPLATGDALSVAELVELAAGTGTLLYYPVAVPVTIGDVFYLRERQQPQTENGLIIQVIRIETAAYAQVDQKVLWRLLTSVRAQELHRVHHEPPEVIDQFLVATIKVRAAIVNGVWTPFGGQAVTRNVDIFLIDPQRLTDNILRTNPRANLFLGTFKQQPVTFSGRGLDKVNLITGMKGSGKSHLAKAIIDGQRQCRMSTVVIDINQEYRGLPNTTVFRVGDNLRFRLDRVEPGTFAKIIRHLAPFAERTDTVAIPAIYRFFRERLRAGTANQLDIDSMIQQDTQVFPGSEAYLKNMRASYRQSLETLATYNLFSTGNENIAEDQRLRQPNAPATLTSTFYELDQLGQAGVVVFEIGGQPREVQEVVVDLVIDGLKALCQRQYDKYRKDKTIVPVYPTVMFEEAHMYMDDQTINDLIPVIRHLGMNLFFVTNTPGELPDSVFRLLDNLFLTRMVNEDDIGHIAGCGLTDKDTIKDFAPQIPKYHALALSSTSGVTSNFPFLFEVDPFKHLPSSGETRSMWEVLEAQP
ncbi:ATP-binding protein [Candidatus Oscillochloris fontis]|uniref:ATP-binding protein n=1 Tax=Candidatus Oscillochloris fontis TaxID=2496868 RepID=UPI001375E324|nr:DUF87 domain-containing protein [Candidatus Oscillochloris fontis]